MNRVCIIGARSGSKSIINKNLQQIRGKSLLRWSVEKATNSLLFDKIYVSTDSEVYCQEVLNIDGVEAVLRPASISCDSSHEFEYIQHVIHSKAILPNVTIARMQCTSPFQSINSISQCLSMLDQSSDCSSVQLVTEMHTSIYKAMHFSENSRYLVSAHPNGSISPNNRQKFPKSYFRSNFYCFKLTRNPGLNYIGNSSQGFIGEHRESIDIDSPFDMDLVIALSDLYPEWLTS